jgi:diaminopimelate epimerase
VKLHFDKMHGIGNDFVVVDWRGRGSRIDADLARLLADRHFGIGCDQLLSIEPATDPDCAFRYGIWNTDGSEAGQCGNGVRCVAAWLHRAGLIGRGGVRLQSPSGPVQCTLLDNGRVRVDMGAPRFEPAAIPLRAVAMADAYRLTLRDGQVEVAAVSMGNPHAVLHVADTALADVAGIGPQIENHPDFPERCNVGFMQVVSRSHIALRVFERGVGETLACGTGACAAAVAGIRSGALDRQVRVSLPGGDLDIDWPDDQSSVWMTGPTQFVFQGEWHDDR